MCFKNAFRFFSFSEETPDFVFFRFRRKRPISFFFVFVVQELKKYKGTSFSLIHVDFFPDIDECESDPCQNEGSCDNGLNRYDCDCTSSWMGVNCQRGTCQLKYN